MLRILLISCCILALAIMAACGSDNSDSNDEAGNGGEAAFTDQQDATDTNARVFDRPDILTSEDMVALGLKAGKKYDVSTLPGGVESLRLFWRVDDIAVEYEARFYESHADAVALGTELAEEGSGENAALDDDVAKYVEGIRDRRTVFDFRGTPRPKYGAYAIYGNMIVLCQGNDDSEGWRRCAALVDALESR